MEDIQIIREFKKNARDVYPDAEIYFYGSRVKRTHHEDSDYDVLVVLKEVNPSIRRKLYDIAWEIGFKYDVLIVPVLILRDDFYPLSASPFVNNVKNHGIAI